MNLYQLVAAMVLRSDIDGKRAFTWTELGSVFDVTKDKMRHQLNRFKDKFNIVDEDIVLGWNRAFLAENTPEDEKNLLADLTQLPGDVLVAEGVTYVVFDANDGAVALIDDTVDFAQYPLDDQYNITATSKKTTKKRASRSKVAATKTENTALQPLQFMTTPVSLIVLRNGQPLTIDKTHKNYAKIQSALNTQQWQVALDNIDMKTAITKYSNGRVSVEDGSVTFDGKDVHPKLTDRLLNCLQDENVEALDALSKFLENCDENPDFQVVTRIYSFVQHNDLRIDKDGYILAYKIVKPNFFDKYTGTMDNSPGKVVKMKRNLVNSKDSETCSHGLHVAAKGYLSSYGNTNSDKIVLCRVHPKDFVSIPTDYNDMKARTCEYTVLKDVSQNFRTHTDGIEA